MLTNAHGPYKMNSPYSRIVGYNFDSLSLLLHCDNSSINPAGFTILPDSSPHHHICSSGEWTPISDPSGITTDYSKFGNSSWYGGWNDPENLNFVGGGGVYGHSIYVPSHKSFVFMDRPFTLDCWAYLDYVYIPFVGGPVNWWPIFTPNGINIDYYIQSSGYRTKPVFFMGFNFDMGYPIFGHNLGGAGFSSSVYDAGWEMPSVLDSPPTDPPSDLAPLAWQHIKTSGGISGWPDYIGTQYGYEDMTDDARANQWNHYALTRDGNNIGRFFLNGTLLWEQYIPIDFDKLYNPLHHPTVYANRAYVDEIRVVKGSAKWTSSFTPPTAPHLPPYVPPQ